MLIVDDDSIHIFVDGVAVDADADAEDDDKDRLLRAPAFGSHNPYATFFAVVRFLILN